MVRHSLEVVRHSLEVVRHGLEVVLHEQLLDDDDDDDDDLDDGCDSKMKWDRCPKAAQARSSE